MVLVNRPGYKSGRYWWPFGSTIIAFGLYRTIKNPEYSTLKKSILSVAYVIAGVVITLLIAALLSWLILTLTRKTNSDNSRSNE